MEPNERLRRMVEPLSHHSDPQVARTISAVLEVLKEDEEDPREAERLGSRGLVPISEAMRRSGKSRNTIKNWVKRGLLTEYRSRTNNEIFVDAKELGELLTIAKVHDATHVPATFELPDYPVTPSPSTDESGDDE